jgi:formylglycine-generating enzyme required for sulfatase activity
MCYRVIATVTNAATPPITPSGMVLIPAGTNSGTDPDSGAYSLTVSAFYMDSNLVTKAQWDVVYNWAITNGYTFANTGSGKAANHPVQTVSWHDCAKWCNARSEKEGRPVCYRVAGAVYRGADDNSVTCSVNVAGYRLPTEVEWEYAARGGLSGKRFPWGDTIDHTRANYYGYPEAYAYDTGYSGFDTRYGTGDEPYTSPVGSFPANGYGLYDMAGNVWEWCTDWWPGYEGSVRVNRGGCWIFNADRCRSADRNGNSPDDGSRSFIGFRAALPPGQ